MRVAKARFFSSLTTLARNSVNQLVWLIMRAATFFAARRKLTIHVEGVEFIPRSGPVLIAARHFHYFYDGYIIVHSVPRRLHTIVALDWIESQLLRRFAEFVCWLAGWLVILRSERFSEHAQNKHWAYKPEESRKYLRQVMQASVRLLRSGELLVIFPEGYPNVDPHPTPKPNLSAFLPFRQGFVRMVELAEHDHRTRVAIVPAGLVYAREPGGRWCATVRFGQALYLADFATSAEALYAVEARVQALSGVVQVPSQGETLLH